MSESMGLAKLKKRLDDPFMAVRTNEQRTTKTNKRTNEQTNKRTNERNETVFLKENLEL